MVPICDIWQDNVVICIKKKKEKEAKNTNKQKKINLNSLLVTDRQTCQSISITYLHLFTRIQHKRNLRKIKQCGMGGGGRIASIWLISTHNTVRFKCVDFFFFFSRECCSQV